MKFQACICFGFSLACPRVDCEPKVKGKILYFTKKTKVIAITRLHHEGFYEHTFDLKVLIQFLSWLHPKKKKKSFLASPRLP
jgi:hypothetical protein